MKKYFMLSLLGLLFLFSCKEENSQLFESYSKDGEIVVKVQGNRFTSFDPWKVNIEMTVKGKTQTAFIEVQAEELTEENINFNWTGLHKCIVSFTQKDGSAVTVPITVQME